MGLSVRTEEWVNLQDQGFIVSDIILSFHAPVVPLAIYHSGSIAGKNFDFLNNNFPSQSVIWVSWGNSRGCQQWLLNQRCQRGFIFFPSQTSILYTTVSLSYNCFSSSHNFPQGTFKGWAKGCSDRGRFFINGSDETCLCQKMSLIWIFDPVLAASNRMEARRTDEWDEDGDRCEKFDPDGYKTALTAVMTCREPFKKYMSPYRLTQFRSLPLLLYTSKCSLPFILLLQMRRRRFLRSFIQRLTAFTGIQLWHGSVLQGK